MPRMDPRAAVRASKELSTLSRDRRSLHEEPPPGHPMNIDTFIERQNITHYLDLLRSESDPAKRETLQKLLAEEKAKEANHEIRSRIKDAK
jgi:hypothetical protein